MAKINQRDVTRNQSTLDITHSHIFIGCNSFEEAVFLNNTGADLILEPGTLMLRDASGKVVPAVDDATIANVIGVIFLEEEVTVLDGAELNVNYATEGKLDETKLVLPGATTLDTVIANKTVKDHLNAVGFALTATINNNKLDN